MKNLNEIKIFKAAIFLIAAFLLNSCAGRPEIIITADNIEYPLVTGYYLHNKQLKVVGPKDYTIIDPLEITFYRWYIGRQLIPLSSNEIDISEKINEIVKEKGGDAVINFSINPGNAWSSLVSCLTAVSVGTILFTNTLFDLKPLQNFGVWILYLAFIHPAPDDQLIIKGEIIKFK